MRAVLWDLDGTLADSREFHWRAWRDTMREAGVEITEAQFLASFVETARFLRRRAGSDRWIFSGCLVIP